MNSCYFIGTLIAVQQQKIMLEKNSTTKDCFEDKWKTKIEQNCYLAEQRNKMWKSIYFVYG